MRTSVKVSAIVVGGLVAGGLVVGLLGDTSESRAQRSGKTPLTATQYYQLIKDEAPSYADRTDEHLDEMAEAVCRVLRAGGRWEDLLLAENLDDSATLADLAVRRACFDQAEKLP